MRYCLLAAATFLVGCGQGASSGQAPRRDGAVDLGHATQPDGQGGPETGAQDGASDRGSTPDSASSPDRATDMWTRADLAADMPIGPDLAADLRAVADMGDVRDLAAELRTSSDLAADLSADLAVVDTANAATDSVVEFPRVDASTDGGCVLANSISVAKLPAISFAAYHSSQPQIENYLQAVASAFPAIATYKVLGQSAQGRNVPYLIINATCQANPPAVFANGTHHGDEPSSTESVLAIPDYLLRNSTIDASIRSLLDTYAFYVLPLVNPDGFALDTRENAAGLDINRDYDYPGRPDPAFQTLEAQLMQSLQESVGFHAAIAYHSGAQEVLWPWCYTGDATADAGFFTAAGQRTAQAMSFTVYQQSYDDYPTQGEYIDYAYWRSHTLTATFEVSIAKTPSAALLAGVVASACQGTLAWFQAVNDHDRGSLHAVPATAAARRRFPLTAPFDGTNRLE